MELSFKKIPLYGGAISMEIPSNMVDASLFRQIPDTQEVFVCNDNNTSIIVDLLECVPGKILHDALDDHIKEITHLNGAKFEDTNVIVEETIKNSEKLCSFAGIRIFEQKIAKFGKIENENIVCMAIALIRLNSPASTDVLITINIEETKDKETDRKNLLFVAQKVAESFDVRDVSLFVS